MYDVPVALLIYKRSEQTSRVLDAVRSLRPRRLFVIADGPKDDSEVAACRDVRAIVERGIDWQCSVSTDYASTNLGLARRVSSGLSTVFGEVDRAVVLEDDTLPDPSFFNYCETLLKRYEREAGVMQISGTNLAGAIDSPYSYGFSKYAVPPWGWASWARAWEKYDPALAWWRSERAALERHLGRAFRLWDALLEKYDVASMTWDVQWAATLWRYAGLCAVPSVNLVANIGYGERATFTTGASSPSSRHGAARCELPLRHPPSRAADFDAAIEPALANMVPEFLSFFRTLPAKARRDPRPEEA